MSPEEVLAVIVSFNGGPGLRDACRALRGQVADILLVDNGSGPESSEVLDELERDLGVTVIRLGENRGVGHALNVGVEHARRLGHSWLLTMDQDSVVEEAMVRAYQAAVARDPGIVSLAPVTSDADAGHMVPTRQDYAITSGNLVRLSVFDEVGPYDEAMFVDCLDFDFSLRLRSAGYRITRVPDAHLRHRVGHRFAAPRWVQRFYTLHPPVRRYYMFRNYCYLAERHLRRFPLFILKLGVLHVVLLVLMAFYDPHPLMSYRAVLRGVRDYFRRVTGPAPGFAG